MPTVSASWNASEPIMKVGTWPVRTTIGIESISASVSPVTAFVAPGPRGDQDDARLAGRPRIALGGMHRALFVAHQDVADGVLLEDLVIDRKHGAAGIAEYRVDTLVLQGFDHHFRASHLGRHRFRSFCRPTSVEGAYSAQKSPRDSMAGAHGGIRWLPLPTHARWFLRVQEVRCHSHRPLAIRRGMIIGRARGGVNRQIRRSDLSSAGPRCGDIDSDREVPPLGRRHTPPPAGATRCPRPGTGSRLSTCKY